MPSLEAQLDQVGREEETFDVVPAESREGWPKPEAHHIVIDCSMMSYVDSVGVNMLKSVRALGLVSVNLAVMETYL